MFNTKMKHFNNSSEIIKKRKSVRSYLKNQNVNSDDLLQLKEFIHKFNCKSFRFEIHDSFVATKQKVKLGTYGMIKGAKIYLIGIMNSTAKEEVINFGRSFEYIILKATELGIGTCWIVGTFDLKAFSKTIELKGNEKIVMISPLGYEDKAHIKESILRKFLNSNNRKNWEKIFFNKTLNNPLSKDELNSDYIKILEMVRLAPSAANTQAWRIIKDESNFHFYLDTAKMYKTSRHHCGYNDLGIAKAHFELTAKELHIEGKWDNLNLDFLEKNRYEYLFSWITD
jgi:nitroreductase